MEKFKHTIVTWQDRLDCRWRALPVPQKRRIVIFSFAAYLLVTLAVVLQAMGILGAAHDEVMIEHIRNPLAKDAAAKNQMHINYQLKYENNERD